MPRLVESKGLYHVAHRMLSADSWLCEVSGRRSFRLDTAEDSLRALSDSASVERRDVQALLHEDVFVYAKVPVCAVEAVGVLEGLGFHVVDTGLAFAMESKDDAPRATSRVRPASSSDEPAVARLAARAFSTSRFHLDPLFGRATANRVKEAWASSYFAGTRGQAMVVAQADNDVLGFLLLLKPDSKTAVIDLIAVDESSRGSGLGRDMIAFAWELFPGVTHMNVQTQAANVGAARFYESMGFSFDGATYCLHAYGAGGFA